MSSVGEELPKMIERSRELLQGYIEIGPPGAFAAVMINQEINFAIKALAEGDVVKILQAYNMLEGHR